MLKLLVIMMMLFAGTEEPETQNSVTNVSTEEIVVEENLLEEEFEYSLQGYDRYSEEYLGELYMNTIHDVVTYSEWDDLADLGYDASEIGYILLIKYGYLEY